MYLLPLGAIGDATLGRTHHPTSGALEIIEAVARAERWGSGWVFSYVSLLKDLSHDSG